MYLKNTALLVTIGLAMMATGCTTTSTSTTARTTNEQIRLSNPLGIFFSGSFGFWKGEFSLRRR